MIEFSLFASITNLEDEMTKLTSSIGISVSNGH